MSTIDLDWDIQEKPVRKIMEEDQVWARYYESLGL